MQKHLVIAILLSLPTLSFGQIQLLSGYNFGQFIGGGPPSLDGTTGDPVTSIGSNFRLDVQAPNDSDGGFVGNNGLTGGYNNGFGTIYWDGTNGSSVYDYSNGVEILATDVGVNAVNGATVQGYNIGAQADSLNLALTTAVANNRLAFIQNTTGFSDYDPSAFEDGINVNDGNLTFAASVDAPVTINWYLNGSATPFATTNLSGAPMTVYSVDLPTGFYDLAAANLVAEFSGAATIDNIQFNGLAGDPPPTSLTFWKGGDGVWTNASTPTNWTEEGTGPGTGTWAPDVATFKGASGTITIDNTDGAVIFTGAKFEVDGYTVAGDALTTNTANTIVQVGDGTGASATMTTTISSVITGSGGIDKTDAGTLVLSGDNSYAGMTTATAGFLQIDGAQTGTGMVTIKSGATLRGTGSTAAAVTVENGGTLAGTSGSFFTMAGLALNPTSNLTVTLGAPNTDKLFLVNGNLTLDGLLNINNTAGFGNGTYRLIDYTGSLTDNGLSIGSVLGSTTDFTVMTGTANQIGLLVNSTSLFRDSGGGTWTTVPGSGWTNSGGAPSAWSPNFAIFQGTAGTITVDNSAGAVVFTGAQFSVDGYTLAGDSLTTNTANTSLRVGDGTSAGAVMTAVISAPIAGTGSIDKRDLGTLTLTGANTYTGGTKISEGTLKLGTGGSIVGNITNNATLAIDRTDAFTFSAVISGTGAVIKQGSGATTLTGDNTYTGTTTVTAGTLNIGSGGTTGSIAGNITNNATISFNRSNALTYAGNLTGTGNIVQLGSGTTSLTGANSHTGGTTVSAGTLSIGSGGTTGSITDDITNNATVTFNRSNALTYDGVISGSGSVVKLGSGITTFTGDNSYTGVTTVSAGTLMIDGDQSNAAGGVTVASGAALGGTGETGADVIVANGGALLGESGGTFAIANLTLGATSNVDVTLGTPSTTTLFQVNGDLTLDGVLNIEGKTGFGEGLYRLFSYTGTLTDNTLALGETSVPATSFTIQTTVNQQVNLVYAAAPLIWNDDVTVWSTSNTSGAWEGTSGGGWQPGLAIFQGDGGTITVDDGQGSIRVTGVQFAADDYSIVGDGITTNTANTAFRVGDGTSAGANFTATVASNITGTGGVDKTDLGTLVLSGTNTYTGGTRITSGVLEVTKDASIGASTGTLRFNGGTLRAGAALTLARPITVAAGGGSLDTAANNVSLSGAISGSGNLTKSGLGVLTISSSSNTHTGMTTIAEGAVVLNAGKLGHTNISSGARLAGIGTIQGNLTSNGTLSPGNSPGTINVVGNLALNPTSTFAVEIASASSFDKLIVGGTASLDGTLAVTGLNGFVPTTGMAFKIIEASNGVNGTFSTMVSPFAQNSVMQRFEAVYNPFDVTLTYTQLPFAGLSGTANQIAIGTAIDSAIGSNSIPLLATSLNALTAEALVRDAMLQLSPQIYTRWYDQAVYTNTAIVRQAETRLAAHPADVDRGGSLWFDVVRRQTSYDATIESEEAKGATNGIVVGGDISLSSNTKMGLIFGYADESLDLGRGDSETEVQRFSAAIYARYETVRWFMEGVFGASYSKYTNQRQIIIPGYSGSSAQGDNDGSEVFASVRAGFHIPMGVAKITPYLALQHTGFSADELIEKGAGNASLTVHEQRAYSLASRAGVVLAFPYTGESLTLTPKMDLAWRYDFRSEPRIITADLGNSSFDVTGDEPPDSGFIAGLGLDAGFASGITAYTRLTIEKDTAADKAFEARAGMDYSF
ncbi:MAG: autotransporter domain-containing protein [Cephaloticoccus sp.]|nr:autotransporter domain-containing protein [Cephaloticoccus sp.]